MKLITFIRNGCFFPGALLGNEIADLGSVAESLYALIALQKDQGTLAKEISAAPRLPLSQVLLAAPIPVPARNIFCVGKNYAAHAREFHRSGFDATSAGDEAPAQPIIFTKATTSVIGPNASIRGQLDATESVDYEGELAVVIGRGGLSISRSAAMEHVFGYTIVNDVTSRTQQHAHKQWFLGKSIDTFCPMGPAIVTADEIPDPGLMHLTTHVNGELRQDAYISELIFDIPTLIETLSRNITLMPGDIIATGTPQGVGIGFDPPRFLARGDTIEITIDLVGSLRNCVI
jgi:2-keto-4-pentenoate hydratase/2-oxohepta-3-ene-1,7-dioic acid hydratase in catechol pathway